MKIICKESSKSIVKEKNRASDIIEGGKNIFCVYCNNLITKQNFYTKVNDNHKHVFANPHGIVFEIACFKEAFGCTVLKDSSNEFSWFSGFVWQIVICNSCLNHLGWLFSSNSNSFFGLILEKLYYN